MAEETGLTMDFKDFDKKFDRLVKKTIPEVAGQALFEVGPYILRDAIMEEPRAPHLWGGLWRSQRVLKPEFQAMAIMVTVGFNIAYAARLHEAPNNWNWTLPGSGPKYLESKLIKNKRKYMEKAADKIRAKAK